MRDKIQIEVYGILSRFPRRLSEKSSSRELRVRERGKRNHMSLPCVHSDVPERKGLPAGLSISPPAKGLALG